MNSNENISKRDIRFMRLALREAKKGMGRTAPNPCVGAIIVRDDIIISRGYHKKAGTPHAEVHALRKAGEMARGATIYVTLEPCNHTGRTPPCSHAVAAAGITRVVVGMEDPNPLVSGSGNDFLRNQGVEVLSGVLAKECQEINLPFIKHITTGRPFVVMKAGMSLDGKLSYQDGKPGKMTGPKSRQMVHRLRDSFDSILIGSGTLLADNPSLTTRRGTIGRDPLRVILDSRLKIPLQSKVLHLDSIAKTLIFCSPSADRRQIDLLARIDGVEVKVVQGNTEGRGLNLQEVLEHLGKCGVCSVLVEGGAAIHGAFLKESLVDRVMLFVAPLFAGEAGTPLINGFSVNDNKSAPVLKNVLYKKHGEDLLVQGDFFSL